VPKWVPNWLPHWLARAAHRRTPSRRQQRWATLRALAAECAPDHHED
jgi:hypothetical protein